jgi:DNA-binding response OmpR family regulator
MTGTSKRILCIEDDSETAGLIAEELIDRGYQVALASNGDEGFDAILTSPPDLVLADINMPVISGFELLERLTGIEPRFATVPFIFLTALADRASELRGWRLGADDFITKPVDFEILNARIAARLTHVARASVWPKRIGLAEREVETLTWAARGKTSAEIATILGLSKRTVDFHINNARSKLGVITRTQAVMKACSGQLISP